MNSSFNEKKQTNGTNETNETNETNNLPRCNQCHNPSDDIVNPCDCSNSICLNCLKRNINLRNTNYCNRCNSDYKIQFDPNGYDNCITDVVHISSLSGSLSRSLSGSLSSSVSSSLDNDAYSGLLDNDAYSGSLSRSLSRSLSGSLSSSVSSSLDNDAYSGTQSDVISVTERTCQRHSQFIGCIYCNSEKSVKNTCICVFCLTIMIFVILTIFGII